MMIGKFEAIAILASILISASALGDDGPSLGPCFALSQYEPEHTFPADVLPRLNDYVARADYTYASPEEPLDSIALAIYSDWPGLTGDVVRAVTYESPRLEFSPIGNQDESASAGVSTWSEVDLESLPIRSQIEELSDAEAESGWTGSAVSPIDDASGRDVSLDALQRLPPDEFIPSGPSPIFARLGWWSVHSDGDPTKIGEYQSLNSSLFADVDGLLTDGVRTVDFYGTVLDDKGLQAGWRSYRPSVSTRAEYQHFLRRLDHNPLSGFPDVAQQMPGDLAVKEDLNVGEDYAIRVQELRAHYKGRLTRNINWRLNLWSMRKHGERQVNAMAHCATCHVLSQRQRIDWLTMEAEPVLEGTFGPATVQYSRSMRTFSQDDQLTTRPYNTFGFVGDLPYAVVPENFTAVDRLKIGVDLPGRVNAYGRLYSGNTENQFRDTNRRFRGLDLRITDRSINGVTLTGYAKKYIQSGQRPHFLLPQESAATIRSPINYDRTTAGLSGRWRPFRGQMSLRSGLTFSGGYEYRELERENALFAEQVLTVDQSSTITNSMHLRASMRWAPQLDTYLRYRLAFIDDPLFGVPVRNTATNTSLPNQQHLVEIGSTWNPVESFLVSASLGIDNSWNLSDVAYFQEDDYHFVLTSWYAPTPRWSVSGGLAFYSNWIDQDITLGSKSNPATFLWDYGGRSTVLNIGTTYARTKNLMLLGGLEFVRGSNVFNPPCCFADLRPLSDVIVETARVTAGLDYNLRCGIDCYVRCQVFDYEDKSETFNSGTVNMLLGGVTVIY